jgi:flagellar basal-body rod protein FlgB
MSTPDTSLLGMLHERMTWLHQRQDVLSQNVANADTPGYVARDLKPQDFSEMLRGESTSANRLAVTDARHISLTPSDSTRFEDVSSPDQEANPNGNAVSLEQEMIKVADTQVQFQAAANLYTKALTLMKTAIGH